MEEASSATAYCNHCKRQIPSANLDLHTVHCKRNLERCNLCGEMVAKTRAEEHYEDVHSPINCSLCGEDVERELFTLHQGEKCLQRIVTCNYCDFPIAAIDLDVHADQCGNRTEMCIPCNKYVRLRELVSHNLHCHNDHGDIIGTSRSQVPHAQGEHSHGGSSKRKLLVTFAVTGIAIIIGTLVLQKRSPT
ncbi:hypothetical protein KP509_1Z136800 [Ceratopteris richardii]|nr:hypothetical protein KP509_1Z136800 [Ceratopteris richardii]